MAWFIWQSAVMILLAFLVGLLVGWIFWGRRLRALLIEVRSLRAFAAACEANHGTAAKDGDQNDGGTVPERPVESAASSPPAAPVHIPAPRAEVTDVADLEALSAGAPEDTLTDEDLAGDGDLEDGHGFGNGHRNGAPTIGETETYEEFGAITAAGSVGFTATGETAADLASDDLVRIEGIGPKIAAALNAGEIRTYRQLADADEPTLWAAVNAAGITFAPSLVTWSQQARLLADGDESGFLSLTDRLIAGRDVGPTTAPEPEPKPEPEAEPDDLARIEGIGPKIAAALIAAGIRTYRHLAEADEDAQTAAINAAGITFAPSLVTWSEQARLLADGEEDAFAALTARLIAGRRVDDDLERIEGIGPQMAAALHAAGIRTYRALADCSDTRLRNAISGSGLSFAPSIVTWARQARLLADGDEEGFADLTRRLVAGRDEGRV